MNFKITNLTTKAVLYMNEKETQTFRTMQRKFISEGGTRYHYENLTQSAKAKKISLYNNILFTLGAFIVFYISIFAMLFIFSKIDTFIFSL
jgi:hypothetical protein